jgi:SPP1 gp7 family putative phage head morphogenesis protein
MSDQIISSRKPSVVQIMEDFNRDLARREKQQFVEMGQRWVTVEQALEYNITQLANEIDARRTANKPIGSSALERLERYKELLQQTLHEAAMYEQYATRVISSEQAVYGEMAIAAAQATIRGQIGSGRTFNQIDVGAVQDMVGMTADGKPLFSLLKNRALSTQMVSGLTDALVQATALGYNPRKSAGLMRDGLTGGLSKALVIARTEQIRVFREAGRAQYEASGVVKTYTRHCAFSERTCLACIGLDGKVYLTDEIMDSHPECRCFMTPNVEGVEQSTRRGAQEWLAKQDKQTQQSILGGHYDLYKSGIPLSEMVKITDDPTWGPTMSVRPLAELSSN